MFFTQYIFQWNLFEGNPATRNMSKELKEFKIIHFNRRRLSFMYQNHLNDEDKISIVLNISQQGGPFQFTTKLKPYKCQLWTDFSCVSTRLHSNLYWSSSPKVVFNLSFFHVRKNMSYSKFYKNNYRLPGIGIINVMNREVKLISWSRFFLRLGLYKTETHNILIFFSIKEFYIQK